MASSIPLASGASFPLPSGYKFCPTDEDIVVHYLRPRAVDQPLPSTFISDQDILNHNPWDLVPEGASEKYFFYNRVLKGATGIRWKRAGKDGFWKASGNEVPIFCSGVGSRFLVGLKRTHVFYLGKPTTGQRSNWVMQEYRLAGAGLSPYHVVRPCTNNDLGQSSSNGDVVAQKHDGPADILHATAPSIENTPTLVNPDKSWVVCRIYKNKMRNAPVVVRSSSSSGPEEIRFFDFLGQGNKDQGTTSTSRLAAVPHIEMRNS